MLERLLLFTASAPRSPRFIYEIDWIRMLSLVLGSATHSFELMLSAFILGLALGALWIRSRADRLSDPVRALGLVQWAMGCLALATLPLYVASFDWIAALLSTFARTDLGYAGFTVARYALCLLVIMLPATFCAGMTLPLITRTLLRAGRGERAIGAVYGWNTLGSIVGRDRSAGWCCIPLIGAQGHAAHRGGIGHGDRGAAARSRRPSAGRRVGRLAHGGGDRGAVVVSVVGRSGAGWSERLLASGVFRSGRMPERRASATCRSTATAARRRCPCSAAERHRNALPRDQRQAGRLARTRVVPSLRFDHPAGARSAATRPPRRCSRS